jgi:hypothetical protein
VNHAHTAQGHHHHANHHATEASKLHADSPSEAEVE